MGVARTNKYNPCPICGHTHWCYFLGRNTVVCMRIPSNTPKKSKCGYGGYIHRLDGYGPYGGGGNRITVLRDAKLASLDTRHAVYTAMLNLPELALTVADYRRLAEWGVSVEMAKRRCYRRLPLRGRACISRQLMEMGYILEGIPGFYYHDKGYWTFTTGPGLIFPSLSPEGKIQGFQVRLDDPKGGSKYVWFSSAGRPGGTSSGAPWHVSRPARVKCRAVVITEGIRKADVISEYLGVITVGAAGVNNWQGIPQYVEQLGMPVVVAYDMDILAKPPVFEAFRALVGSLKGQVYVAAWDPQYKGLDDLLVAGRKPKIIPLNEFLANQCRSTTELAAYPSKNRAAFTKRC